MSGFQLARNIFLKFHSRIEQKVTPASHRFLLFASVGDSSHAFLTWSKNKTNSNRGFDIAIVYYGSDNARAKTLAKQCDYFFKRKGTKFQNYITYEKYFSHEYVLLLDDDISLSQNQIRNCFEYCANRNIPVASPLHSLFGRFSWPHMCLPKSQLPIYTNFVEMTAPLFAKRSLDTFCKKYAPISDELVGYGIDFMVSSICFTESRPFELIPFCKVHNPHTICKGRTTREIDDFQSREERLKNWHTLSKKHHFVLTDSNQIWVSFTKNPQKPQNCIRKLCYGNY